jgi:hypothetical protein
MWSKVLASYRGGLRVTVSNDLLLKKSGGAKWQIRLYTQLERLEMNASADTQCHIVMRSSRTEYMRKTNEALYAQSGSCPFAAFGAIIVNHTSDSIVCEGASFRTGDPTIHGEISAINACTTRFTDEAQSWLSYVQSLKQHPRRTWLSFWQGLRAFRRQQTSCEDLHPVS